MKHSIRTKLITLIVVALFLLTIIIGGVSLASINGLTSKYADQYMSLLCENEASKINAIFSPLEKSIDYMSINALEELSNPMNLVDQIYFENYMDKMKSILFSMSSHTDGAVATYLRINPDICGPLAGFFMTKESIDDDLKMVETTDLSLYDEDDTEHVGWYYQPIKAGKPIWMMPYYNKNIDIYMISYVVPLFKNNMTVGVLGIDINFNHITEQVKEIKVYKTGYAYITDEQGKVIYHPYLQMGDTVTPQNGWRDSSCELSNGMILNITVPVSEINEERNILIRYTIIGAIILMILFIGITFMVTKKMISPLQELNKIAIEISSGDYDVNFDFERPDDEIGQLTKSFENTVTTLKEYTTYINGLAYKDSLTGVRNRTAYDYQIEELERFMANGANTQFTIAVFDVNNLKYVNDNLGHEKGDILIQGACKLICRTFSHSAVFRIGGDEFVAIIKDASDEKINELFNSFRHDMEETWSNEEYELRVSVAYGYSKHDSASDNNKVEPAFKRADDMMYANKKAMKAAMQNNK